MRLRVMTLNVWNEEGDSDARMRVINQGLRRLKPDLLGLQEVVRTGDRDQLGVLTEGLGLQATHQRDVAAVEPPHAAQYGGNAIATRWPHRIVEWLDLRQAGELDVPWRTLAARVAVPDLGDMLFIVTTTSWRPEAEAARELQVMALTDLDARHRTDLPTVIAGDFTAVPEAACIRYLTGAQALSGRSVSYHDAWALAGDGPGHTWTTANPSARTVIEQVVGQGAHHRRIDYVFVGSRLTHPKAQCTIDTAALAFDRPVDGIWASDHFGVVVDLDITIA